MKYEYTVLALQGALLFEMVYKVGMLRNACVFVEIQKCLYISQNKKSLLICLLKLHVDYLIDIFMKPLTENNRFRR